MSVFFAITPIFGCSIRAYSTNTRMPNFIKSLKSAKSTSSKYEQESSSSYSKCNKNHQYNDIAKNYQDYINEKKNKNIKYVDEEEWLRQKAAEHSYKN